MPARILRPCVDSERLAALSYEAETLFFRLLQVADDYGLAHASPLIVASTCYPAGRGGRHVDPAHVAGWLDELARAGIIRVTETSSGKLVLQIMRFGQRIRGRPRHPAPPEWLDDARRWAREAATTGAPQLASSPSDAAASADCGRLQQTAADCSTAPQHVAGRRGQPPQSADNCGQPPQSADDIRYTDTVYGITKLPDTGAVEPGAIAPADTGACAGSDYLSETVATIMSTSDHIRMAVLATGDSEDRSLRGWARLYRAIYDALGHAATEAWRETCIAFVHEVAAGERPRRPGAALTARLKRLCNGAAAP